ncbi:uncharacterized protein LOC106088512 [Stomoxys calcitrans]|uniref:Major facilitator superfamily (MFS) profile domain-containing protein n=1 Tax=Stomoxys calcitrans TaxID=35570 RepID=A0A1I8PHF5_STOCA|nr:uncharacterized protein LOC106088512 [Stomoxys calcitrans]
MNSRSGNTQLGYGNFKQLQLSPLVTGFLIFMSGGMCLAQSVGWIDGFVKITDRHFYYSWFIAVIIGALLTLPLRNLIPRRFLMGASSLLILVGGIIFVSVPFNMDGLIAGRYLNGIGIGLVTVPYLMYASEISLDSNRGKATGLEQLAIALGVTIQMVSTNQWKSTGGNFTANSLHGIFDIIFAVLALGSLFYFIESPVDFLRFGDDDSALKSLGQLQTPPTINMETHTRLAELRDYVREEEDLPIGVCFIRSILPLLKMIFYRSAVLALTYTTMLTVVAGIASLVNGSPWSPCLAACLRVLGSSLTLIVIDKFGRKIPSLLWILILGGLMIPIAVLMGDLGNLMSIYYMETVVSLWASMYFFVGLFAPNTSTYMSEAFPLRTKCYCMTICVVMEQIIQIVIINTVGYYGRDDGALLAVSIVVLAAGVGLIPMIPETKKTSLKEAQKRIASVSNCNWY